LARITRRSADALAPQSGVPVFGILRLATVAQDDMPGPNVPLR
jgi:hypothetical protein